MDTQGYYLEESQLRNSVLFCGAGISSRSGIPLASDLKAYICEKLISEAADLDEITNAELPFELFLETVVAEQGQYLKLLDLYTQGQPNPTHIFIAKLVKSGLLKKIVTTNFDLLIEKAFFMEGLVENVHYKRFYLEEHFSTLNSQTIAQSLGSKAGLFKIHGTADDAKSVRTVLQQVASKLLTANRKHILRDLFSLGDHKQVIIMGYSCSDVFDVSPIIQSIEGTGNKAVLFIEHVDESKAIHPERVENVQVKDSKNPFKHFSGKRVYCNTDMLVKQSWERLQSVFGKYNSRVQILDWKPHIDSWFEDFRQNNSLISYTAGTLLLHIPDFDKAIQYFHNALDNCGTDDRAMRFRCCVALGSAHKKQGHPQKAIPYYEQALKIAEGSENVQRISKSNCYVGLADCYDITGDSDRASKLYAEAIELERNRENVNSFSVMSKASGGIGAILNKQGYYDDSVEFHRRGLDIAQSFGDTSGEALSYVHLGNVCKQRGEYPRAIQLYTKALDLAKLCSDKATEAGCYTNMAAASIDAKNWLKAEHYIKEALKIAAVTGDESVEPLCYSLLGDLHRDKYDFNQGINFRRAIEYYYRALTIAEDIQNGLVCLACYVGLSSTYLFCQQFQLAISCSLKGVECAKMLGSKTIEAKCYGLLGIAFSKLKNDDEAAKSFEKQQACLEQARKSHSLNAQIDQIKALIPTRDQESSNAV
jgi:tetratricopeptide (TPR) repeat protein